MSRNGSLVSLLTGLLLLAATIMVSGCSGPEGNPAEGKRWYRMNNCSACHGEHGNDGKGPNIAGLNMSYYSFLHRLRNARSQIMPVFDEKKISDQDAADILAYLKNPE